MTIESIPTLNKRDESIRLLANGFSSQFSEDVAADERFHDLLMELAEEFVAREIPIVDEDTTTDVAYELMMRCTTKEV